MSGLEITTVSKAMHNTSIKIAAEKLGVNISTLRDFCNINGIGAEQDKVLVKSFDFRKYNAGGYINKCKNTFCGGFPLGSGYCVQCYAKRQINA